MTTDKAIKWVPWDFSAWLLGTMDLDANAEFCYFRLCMWAYENNDPVVRGSSAKNAARCKKTVEEYEAGIDFLLELDKIKKTDDGFIIHSVVKRLEDANRLIEAKQVGAAKARKTRELKEQGCSSTEIALMIKKLFPDDQAPKERKKDKQKERKKNTLPAQGDLDPIMIKDANDLHDAFLMFNLMAEEINVPAIAKLTDPRKKHLKARLKDCGGVDGWKAALVKVAQSDFLSGRKVGSDWSVTFDWLVKPSNFTKVMEGNYDKNTKQGHGLMSALDRI